MNAAVCMGDEKITVAVSAGSGSPRVSHHPLEQSDRGTALREALTSAGVQDRKYLLVLPRRAALFREFELPSGEADELLQMVRFQLERDLPLSPDEVHYSYVTSLGEGKLRVQVTAAPKADLDPLLEELSMAGLSPERVVVSIFGLTAWAPSQGTMLLAALTPEEVELGVVGEGRLLHSRSTRREGEVAPLLAGEFERTMRGFTGRALDRGEDRLCLLADPGEDPSRISEEISEKLGCAVVSETSEAAALEGLLRLRDSIPDRIPDLLHPPTVSRGFRVTRWHRVAVAAGLALLLLIVVLQWTLSSRRGKIERLEGEMEDVRPQVKEVKENLRRLRLANNWGKERFSWIDFLDSLSGEIDHSEMVLLRWQVEENGELQLSGKIKTKEAMNDLLGRLGKSDWVTEVKTRGLTQGADEAGYKWNFKLEGKVKGLVQMEAEERGKRR